MAGRRSARSRSPRHEPGRSPTTQIALLQTFADQAVIAIENVRLFTELQARTADLTRSVGQLTALGEVGQAVSSSLDLETVLTTIVSRAVQLSGIGRRRRSTSTTKPPRSSSHARRPSMPAELVDGLRATRGSGREKASSGGLAVTLEPVQVPDIAAPGAYESRLRETLIEPGVPGRCWPCRCSARSA